MMARSRDVMLLALLAIAAAAPALASPAMTVPDTGAPVMPVQYYHEERPYVAPAPRYYAPPPPRRVCWTEYRRVLVGYDRWGRPIYTNRPRQVCGYR